VLINFFCSLATAAIVCWVGLINSRVLQENYVILLAAFVRGGTSIEVLIVVLVAT